MLAGVVSEAEIQKAVVNSSVILNYFYMKIYIIAEKYIEILNQIEKTKKEIKK